MDCARVMRGTRSRASALTLRAASAAKRSALAVGWRSAMSTAPGLSSAASSVEGRRTRRTTSASWHAAAASAASVAPAFSYRSSGNPARAPAPRCTTTCAPLLISFAALSGTSATRCSPGVVSAGTAIRIIAPLLGCFALPSVAAPRNSRANLTARERR